MLARAGYHQSEAIPLRYPMLTKAAKGARAACRGSVVSESASWGISDVSDRSVTSLTEATRAGKRATSRNAAPDGAR
jgi:hypothetical protein